MASARRFISWASAGALSVVRLRLSARRTRSAIAVESELIYGEAARKSSLLAISESVAGACWAMSTRIRRVDGFDMSDGGALGSIGGVRTVCEPVAGSSGNAPEVRVSSKAAVLVARGFRMGWSGLMKVVVRSSGASEGRWADPRSVRLRVRSNEPNVVLPCMSIPLSSTHSVEARLF